ncbi:hypothetical protein V6N13_133694 [Hibiscus sabdariffa]|uniref:Uncharacterized protein n=1 Tax=Hibiscus sabdariffa TaxID=183260 RepID=A0ABR2R0C1_9ROSI
MSDVIFKFYVLVVYLQMSFIAKHPFLRVVLVKFDAFGGAIGSLRSCFCFKASLLPLSIDLLSAEVDAALRKL